MNVTYTLDGNNMATAFGITVQSVRGNLDTLQRKEPTGHDWADEDGIEAYTLAADIKFEPREIVLRCLMKATTKAAFLVFVNALRLVLEQTGKYVLTIPNPTTTNYTVYCTEKVRIEPYTGWASNVIAAQFSLRFTEPTPKKAT